MAANIRISNLFQGNPAFDWLDPPADAAALMMAPVLRFGGPSLGQTVLFAPDGDNGAARPGSSGTGGSGGGGSGTTTSGTASGLVINISWDSSVSAAPSSFTAGVLAAAQYLQSQITDAVTVNIAVGYGEVNGYALGSNSLGSSQSYLTSLSYSSLAGALTADATSADDRSAVATLPASSPVAGNFWTTTAQAKALGLAAATGAALDGYVGFSSALPFDYSTSDGITAGTYDFNGVALHELTEVMGRILFTGMTIGTTANSYDAYDLFHYASAGVRDFSASTPGYLSFDGGTTNAGTFNTASGGDAGDWASSMGHDAFNAFSSSGVVNAVSTADLRAMDVIGWNRAVPSTPTGVAASAVSAALAGSQGASGLAAGAALAAVVQVGGSSAGSYSYTLGGTGAAAFTLATAANAATLSAGAAGVAGAAGGQLYALTVQTTDTTSGNAAPVSPIDVIVGSGGADTIGIATLAGSLAAATPSFIYGLAGADRIDGTGMTGKLYLNGGAGADTLTGGSGANAYLYGATTDSTVAAMDTITNFHAATDLIDLKGLGSALKYAGKIKGGNLGAHSVGWQASGGNTLVYVNTSAATESLSAANMKIALVGAISLGSGNILHL
ncbi:MAG: hypothetical protein BGP12_05760 [Rhodospirillales bacterium 70-18]|nr:MAG: hypothetical protein BGP12_05760 [Rhodospirillales bacterium 70-18]